MKKIKDSPLNQLAFRYMMTNLKLLTLKQQEHVYYELQEMIFSEEV